MNIKKSSMDIYSGYVDLVLERSNVSETEVLKMGKFLSLTDYYFCGIITLFLLLFGISFSSLFGNKDMALGKLLGSKNVSAFKLVMAEFLAFLIYALITVLLISVIGGAIIEKIELKKTLLEYMGMREIIMFFIKSIPCIIMICAMQFFLYEITNNIISSVLLQFTVACGMAYISGCFYPIQFFPEIIQNISQILPSGICFEHMRGTIQDLNTMNTFIFSTIYICLFITLSTLIRKHRLQVE